MVGMCTVPYGDDRVRSFGGRIKEQWDAGAKAKRKPGRPGVLKNRKELGASMGLCVRTARRSARAAAILTASARR